MSHHKRCLADGCPNFLGDEKRFDAKYCSTKCLNREARRRWVKRQNGEPVAVIAATKDGGA